MPLLFYLKVLLITKLKSKKILRHLRLRVLGTAIVSDDKMPSGTYDNKQEWNNSRFIFYKDHEYHKHHSNGDSQCRQQGGYFEVLFCIHFLDLF